VVVSLIHTGAICAFRPSEEDHRSNPKRGLANQRAAPVQPEVEDEPERGANNREEGRGQSPKRGKRGYVDDQGRIWIKDRAHADVPDHWDVQIDDGEDYIRVDQNGGAIS
jgi:hypothetical protein